jgi:hypothetical protein
MNVDDLISGGITGGIFSIIYIVYKMFKHSSCRSKCCGHDSSLNLDLTPPPTPAHLLDPF